MNTAECRHCEELLDVMRAQGGSYDYELIKKAFDLCVAAHAKQKRQSGEAYYIHPFSVATLLG